MFKVQQVAFDKKEDEIEIWDDKGNLLTSIPESEWISVITEMSHKPGHGDQHKAAEQFHLGK